MNQRDAKRLACNTAADLIRSAMDSDEEAQFRDHHGNLLSDSDMERYSKALQELRDELLMRGQE